MANVSVIIPAAGAGSRMGTEIPKPFLTISGKSILGYALGCFNEPDIILEIIIPVSDTWKERVGQIIEESELNVPVTIVSGGSERMFSIKNGLDVVSDEARFVAIHDAVRPFLSKRLLSGLLEAVHKYGAVVPGLPVTDTIKIIDKNNFVTASPDRKFLRAAQTPQLFRRELIREAYNKAVHDQFIGTDDASIVEHFGEKVIFVEGESENFKITYREDLERALRYLESQQL